MADVKIRKLTYDDAEAYVKLNVDVWCVAFANIMPKEVLEARRQRQPAQIENFPNRDVNKNGHIDYVAEVDGKVVGEMSGNILSDKDIFKDQGMAELHALYIHPDFQHMGIGWKLVKAFEKDAKKLGAKQYVIGVLKANEKARHAYEKYGGVLSDYKGFFEFGGHKFEEVYYIYNIKEN